jgi:hypothetical protein
MDVAEGGKGTAHISHAAKIPLVRLAAFDCAFLAIVTVASLAPYVRHLGFYYDDYSVLARMTASGDHSLLGFYHSVRPATGQRPIQALIFATLYRLFGDDPLGYHVVNAGLLVTVAALLYLVLRQLRLPRLVCVAVPLVYSTLPHYATNRFWLDAYQVTFSVALYLLSLYAGLRAVQASHRFSAVAWLGIAVLGVVGSLLSYEVVYPLFGLNLGLIWWETRRPPQSKATERQGWIVLGGLALAIVAAGLMKVVLVAEHGQNGYQIGFQDGFFHHAAYLVSGAIKLNVGTYLLAFPYVIVWIFVHHFSATAAVVSGVTALASFGYLLHVGRRDQESLARSNLWRPLLGVGFIALVLGYAIFVTNQNVLFRSAGIDNRVNAGAALGVASVLVGVAACLAARLRRHLIVFSTVIACAVAGGVFVINTLSSYWVEAAREQRSILAGIAEASGPTRAWNTVILNGACPEVGPAVVFADQWDLTGALRTSYRDPTLSADVAAEGIHATATDLTVDMTFLGRSSTRKYPYGAGLAVYDAVGSRLFRIQNRKSAVSYLANHRPLVRCPAQRSFAWGLDPSRRWSLP